MEYVLFSLWFTLIRTGAYTLAGMTVLNISVYEVPLPPKGNGLEAVL